jgi:type II secretory pathway pseudopilin PulG
MQAKPRPSQRHGRKQPRQCGVMLLALLIFLAILGLAVTKTSEVWSTALTREREQELLFVGEQYRKAIERYYNATPGSNKVLPPSIEQLLQDDRFPKPQRHLRNAYPDPMGAGETWGVLKQGSRIIGVYSQSDQKPMKKSGFDPRYAEFSAAQSYRGWRFMFKQAIALPGGSAPASPSLPGAPGAFGTPAAPGALGANNATTPGVTIPSVTTPGKQPIPTIPTIPSGATTR